MAEIINKTSHDIVILDQDGIKEIKRIHPSLPPVRIITSTKGTGTKINGIVITTTDYQIEGDLPDFEIGTYYVVSASVKNLLPNRKDLLVPAEVLRTPQGFIYGCKSLGI